MRERLASHGALLLLTIASYPVGLALGLRWLLPLLNAAPAWAVMAALLLRGDRRGAVLAMLAWAATLAVCGTASFALWPRPVDGLVIHGPAYRDEMFAWIRSGIGAESSPRRFVPQHATHLALFVASSLATASLASIAMGAVLMNYMSFYVASLARAGAPAWAVVFLGWQPWALCRVAAFATLGAVLAEPMLLRVFRRPYPGLRAARPYLVAAAVALVADVMLKAALAPSWGLWLRRVLPGSG
jgi:hypothetical protein